MMTKKTNVSRDKTKGKDLGKKTDDVFISGFSVGLFCRFCSDDR